MNKQRLAKINHEIQRILGTLITQQLRDPRLGFSTVTHVEVTNDLQQCKVFVSVIGNREVAAQTLEALQHAARFLRGELGHHIDLRHTPELVFVEDRSTERAIALAQTLREDAERHAPPHEVSAESEDEEVEDDDNDAVFEDDEVHEHVQAREDVAS